MQDNGQMKSIKEVLAGYGIDCPDIPVTDLVLDSREVAIHKAFVAIKGHQLDGRDFIPQAISLGAKLIIAETEEHNEHGHVEMREQTVIVYFHALLRQLSALADAFYGQPSDSLDVIAVTGTNGKTSTVQLTTQLRHALGEKSASIGTLGTGIFTGKESNLAVSVNTTPDAINMQRLLSQYQQDSVKQVAMEASSHALVQGRIDNVRIRVAVFTNLSRDHLDYHGSMAEYAKAKRQLIHLDGVQTLVLNADDIESDAWLSEKPDAMQVIYFSTEQSVQTISERGQYCVASNIQYVSSGCQFRLSSSWGNADVVLPLFGKFNVSNFLAAFASQLALGHRFSALVKAISSLRPVAGRMEIFEGRDNANIIVDYAHTPDALEQVLLAVKAHCRGELVCLFGCGGDRDRGKRSLMGEVAEKFADRIVLTSDNSRSEDPHHIIKDILSGCRQPDSVLVEVDRQTAIKQALTQTDKHDLILVAGKGHEDYQIIGDQVLDYNERQYVQQLLKGNGQ
ncbi:UDP-N-acetylmuramoyl-L-alanyl-D-glutamate--2,6-diaminopimelate ligase [Aestuariibacter sp. AA17]|uniref:UDP-N-acetylmuramyl-tripeptide synthetase n=1 Tax=Fluctibacter corallii TaxID=2984329 RepID=A0ABT3A8G4_9ALTE|nr:UDP-N-acetylmuramoyl-L-alanyl-D-glutamate--2,6-diaminopimelate ligase [Aestuariibacter sp. AA17]MCV2884882.1 UDP-N-acetylmuramoyl-L-alanyl-D-glutamate--2,6-diaminopimelate ligase [Aestuariibacter sp. AA17]